MFLFRSSFLNNSFRHADGPCRTNKPAEVTAYALRAYQPGTACLSVEDYGLVSAVTTRQLTTSATYTHFLVELRIDDGRTVQVVRIQELRQLLAYQLLQVLNTTLLHVALQSEYKVVNDAIAILHDGGTHLHVATP